MVKAWVCRSLALLCRDWPCRDDCPFVCLLILRLMNCNPLPGYLGMFYMESPGSSVAFLVASTFTNQAPLAVVFLSKGNGKEGGGSLGPDFNGCGTLLLI